MIKGFRERYFSDHNAYSRCIPLPAKYQQGAIPECLQGCQQDLLKASTELEQLEIINKFLEFSSIESTISRDIVYQFISDWHAETFDNDSSYFFKEVLTKLNEEDDSIITKSLIRSLEEFLSENSDSLKGKNAKVRKILGYLENSKYTKDALSNKFNEIFTILVRFIKESREILPEEDCTLSDDFTCNTLAAIDYFLKHFWIDLCEEAFKEELKVLLTNIMHFMTIQKFDREFRRYCGSSVIKVLIKLEKLEEFLHDVETERFSCSADCLFYYIEGITSNFPKHFHQTREKQIKILTICSNIVQDKLFDKFSDDDLYTYYALNIVTDVTGAIQEIFSEITDWTPQEIKDVDTCMRISYELVNKVPVTHYSERIVFCILKFCHQQEEKAFKSIEDEIFQDVKRLDFSPNLRGRFIMNCCIIYSSVTTLEKFPEAICCLKEDLKITQICNLSCHGDFCSHYNPAITALVEMSKTILNPYDQYDGFLKELLQHCCQQPLGGWYRRQIKTLLKHLLSSRSEVLQFVIQDTSTIPAEILLYAFNCPKKIPDFFLEDSNLQEIIKKALVTFDEESRVSGAKAVRGMAGDPENFQYILNLLKFGIVFQQRSVENRIPWIAIFKTATSGKNKDEEKKELTKKFLTDFREMLFEHLYPGGSFQRQRYVLKILLETWSILGPYSWKLKHLNDVFSCLDSPYEYVKKLAGECLLRFPEKIYQEWCEEKFGDPEKILKDVKSLMISVKPEDSLQAAYRLKMFARTSKEIFPHSPFSEEISGNVLIFMDWCLKILKQGIDGAKQSILQASSENPLYGTILCIRYLLDDLPRSLNKKRPEYKIISSTSWRNFFKETLILCNEACKIVAPIVNNSSPEGYLPEDCEIIECGERVTPQKMLLCGWRTIKEVTLLLGEFCEKIPHNSSLITDDELIQIGQNFMEILLETKHRGAFEVSAVGFSKLCSRLCMERTPEVANLPKDWLDDLLNAILLTVNETKYKKLCGTRRSAGLPFLIQSILTSCDPSLFHGAMKRLLKESKLSTDGRIHTMNVLRYLFRCSSFHSFFYAKDGLLIAIESFGSSSWAERNSASLLFSALIVRIFGVFKAKGATEELPLENTWNFNEFFREYKPLYKFMLQELRTANHQMMTVGTAPQLYPILLLLERLPTTNGHWAPQKDPQVFIEEILKVPAVCGDLKIRVLAAKTVSTLIHPTDYLKHLEWLLREEISRDPNDLHSKMLQVKEIFRKLAKKDVQMVYDKLEKTIKMRKIHPGHCFIVDKLFIEILLKYIPKTPEVFVKIINQSSRKYLDEYLNEIEEKLSSKTDTTIGRTAVQSSWLLLKLTLDEKSTGDVLKNILTEKNQEAKYPALITALNITLLLNGQEKYQIPEDLLSEISDHEKEFVSSLNENTKSILRERIFSENVVNDLIKCADPQIRTRAYLVMPLDTQNLTIDQVNKTLTSEHCEQEEKILTIRKLLAQMSTLQEDLLNLDVHALLKFSGNDKDDFIRLNLALLIAEMLKSLWINQFKLEFIIPFSRVVMQLLRDDLSDVRLIICTVIKDFGKNDCNDDVAIPSDSYALHLYIEHLLNTVVPKSSALDFLKELEKLEEAAATHELEDISEEEDWRVFDAKEANLFGDREFTIRIIRSFINTKKCGEL
ncbi:hypothetical protein DMENIID0001_072760 [Sergentomyia squamirostris]